MAMSAPSPQRGSPSSETRRTTPEPASVLPLRMLPQPDDETCGPTCLHAVYRYWGESVALTDVIESARSLSHAGAGRGTLAVMLGIDALRRGYAATLHTFNLTLFDPTWFGAEGGADPDALTSKLAQQRAVKGSGDPRFEVATDAYIDFLQRGGAIRYRDLTSRLISGFVRAGRPVLTGLSATYLYRCAREFGPDDLADDVRGTPAGHFVVIHGYDAKTRRVTIADPLKDNPGFDGQRYTVSMGRLVPAIMLGVLTYDANLLVIEPAERTETDCA